MSNINPKPNFQLIGHRGAAGLRPENTLASFAYAAELGLNWVEFDVQLTRDDEWVVIHDLTVDRTTNGHGKITEYSLAEITQLEAGLWFNPQYINTYIPSLDETLSLCNKLGIQSNIELKGADADPEKYAGHLAKWLKTNLPHNMLRPMLSSFNQECILHLRKLLPDYPVGLLVDYFALDTIEIVRKHNLTSINCDVKTITEVNLTEAVKHNIPVLLYTINDPVVAHQWLKRGITAIFTDRPDLLLKG